MVYKKRYGKKKYYKKRYSKKRGPSKRYAKAIVQKAAESKYGDTDWSSVNITDTGGIYHLSALSEGDTEQTRTGEIISPKSLTYRILVRGVGIYTVLRMIIFTWTESSGSTPTLANVLDSVQPLAMMNNTNKLTCRVLRDKTFTLETESGCGQKFIKGFINLKGKRDMTFYGTSSSPRANHLFILFISDGVVDNYPYLTGTARFRFTDA